MAAPKNGWAGLAFFSQREEGSKMVGNAPLVILGIIGVFLLVVALLQWLWNTTMPEVFGLKTVTYLQAMRLLIIAAILFGGGAIVAA